MKGDVDVDVVVDYWGCDIEILNEVEVDGYEWCNKVLLIPYLTCDISFSSIIYILTMIEKWIAIISISLSISIIVSKRIS